MGSMHQWRTQDFIMERGSARVEGPCCEARRTESGVEFWEGGSEPPSISYEVANGYPVF